MRSVLHGKLHPDLQASGSKPPEAEVSSYDGSVATSLAVCGWEDLDMCQMELGAAEASSTATFGTHPVAVWLVLTPYESTPVKY